MTLTVSTRRAQIVDKKRGDPVDYLSDLRCTPLDPANGEYARDVALRLREVLKGPFVLMETFLEGQPDIVEGDHLVVDGMAYPVRSVDVWTWRASAFTHLMLEVSKA
jgi:hypothetical protein